MLLGSLLKSVSKSYKRKYVGGICFDSRKVKKKDIFFAINGSKIFGTKFIKEAISKGASLVVANKNNQLKKLIFPLVTVKNIRLTLSEACSNFYKKKPSNIIAVTGTNGKSSVADFFYQILSLNRKSVASLGTLGIKSKKYNKKTNLTSMDPLSLHKNLQILAEKKIKNVILEASSHGLDQNRLDNLKINAGIFTNLSHDHLDYHKTVKSYFKSKMYLFNNLLKKNSTVITDRDNENFNTINNIAKRKKLKIKTIGSNVANLKVLRHRYNKNNQIIDVSYDSKIFTFTVSLIGHFQIKNLLMAILAARICGLDQSRIFKTIHKIKPVSGRMECVAKLKNNARIVVDFAHTPDALENSLAALKKQFKKNILIVFGCGGERDKQKRKIMGRIAKKYCRKIYVTDDNPRNESPKKIRSDIIKGCKKSCIEIGNRKKAITAAISELKFNEILLVAGKGHENYQDYGKKVLNFSDKKVIKKIVSNKKFLNQKVKYKDFLINKTFKTNFKSINYRGISINSKTIKQNDIFFAIKGKNTDGHKFVFQAIKKGAIKSIVGKKIKKISNNKLIKVKDTFSSLNNLAKVIRDNNLAQFIGITGSVGKTTLKNLLGFVLKKYGKVYHSPHSYNNKFGVPLSICNLKENTEYGIFEIGMDKKGEINNLSKIVKPEIAIITNISEAHIKNFKTLKDIAKAKSEIIDNISEPGNIILNKDDKFFNFFHNKAKKRGIKITSYSLKKKADICLSHIKRIGNNNRLKILVRGKIFYFNTKHSTENIINGILACISVLSVMNLDLKKMKNQFNNFEVPSGRGDIKKIKRFKKNFKIIDESYNANPLSMKSAINNMHCHNVKRDSKKLAFLGDMLELGKKSKKLHKELSNSINRSNIDKVFVYGKEIRETFNYLKKNKKGKIFNSLQDAHDHFKRNIRNGDLLMIKGSNATGLNQFSKNIKRG